MALLQATLTTELQSLGLYGVEADAIDDWTAAFSAYFEDAESNVVSINPAALPAAESAMKGAMVGLSTGGASALQAGILAFWGALVPATAWTTVTAITPPPGLSGLAAAVQDAFDANTVAGNDKNTSMAAIAAKIHPLQLGGTATWPTPVGPQPIL